ALEARMDGYRVMPIKCALQEADIVVTATGNKDIISGDDFNYIKDGCMLANAGHFNVEINEEDLLKITEEKETIKQDIECYTLKDGRHVYLLAGGRLVNLAGEHGQGHPAEIMDLSFAMQALSAKRILEEDMQPGVYKTRDEVDSEVARLKLKAMNIEIDELTTEQKDYMNSWNIGT
ncbi:MAG: adenosylhomocysteinase, partial [Methanosphaera sp.]|nr:adenosylhomocysteinase [Methanosphaera sp.]